MTYKDPHHSPRLRKVKRKGTAKKVTRVSRPRPGSKWTTHAPEFREKAERCLATFTPSVGATQRFNRMLGKLAHTAVPIASDMRARLKLHDAMVDACKNWFDKHPKRKWFWVTLIYPGPGFVPRESPDFDIKHIRKKADKDLRKMGLNAIAVVEIQPITNDTKVTKRGFMVHVHALGYTRKPKRLCKVYRRINKARGKVPPTGVKSIKVKAAKTRGRVRFLASYMTKPPHDGKAVVDPNGKVELRSNIAGMTANLCFRMIEILSQVPLGKAVFGIGTGTDVRKQVMDIVIARHRARPSYADWQQKAFNIQSYWKRLLAKPKRGRPTTMPPVTIKI